LLCLGRPAGLPGLPGLTGRPGRRVAPTTLPPPGRPAWSPAIPAAADT